MSGNRICLFLTQYNLIATSCIKSLIWLSLKHKGNYVQNEMYYETETEEVPVKNCPNRYSRVCNKRSPLNKHSPWKIWQKE